MKLSTVFAISAGGFAFGWLMMATEYRPFLPLVNAIIWANGGAA